MRQQEISEEIVVRLNRGDMKAFDAIYHAYYLYLCAVVTYSCMTGTWPPSW